MIALSQRLLPEIRLEKLPLAAFRGHVDTHDTGVAVEQDKVENKVETLQTTTRRRCMTEGSVCEIGDEYQPPSKKHKTNDSTGYEFSQEGSKQVQQSCIKDTTTESPDVLVQSSLSLNSILLRGIPSENPQTSNQICSQTRAGNPTIPSSLFLDKSQMNMAKVNINITSSQNLTHVMDDNTKVKPPIQQDTETSQAVDNHGQGAVEDSKENGDIKPRVTSESELQFSIVFSSDDDEDNSRTGLLNTQMNNQLDKVQKFLKRDRLRQSKGHK